MKYNYFFLLLCALLLFSCSDSGSRYEKETHRIPMGGDSALVYDMTIRYDWYDDGSIIMGGGKQELYASTESGFCLDVSGKRSHCVDGLKSYSYYPLLSTYEDGVYFISLLPDPPGEFKGNQWLQRTWSWDGSEEATDTLSSPSINKGSNSIGISAAYARLLTVAKTDSGFYLRLGNGHFEIISSRKVFQEVDVEGCPLGKWVYEGDEYCVVLDNPDPRAIGGGVVMSL